jgi:hypothetical protein
MANEFISQLGVLKTATLLNSKGRAPAKESRSSALTYWSGILQPCAVVNTNQAKGLAARQCDAKYAAKRAVDVIAEAAEEAGCALTIGALCGGPH